MKPAIIKSEEQYEAALDHVATLMDAPAGSAQESELELWGTLVELYEKAAHPIPLPDPVAAIKFRMEQAGLARKDLVQYLGSVSKVSEILSGKRSLSIPMMRRLKDGLGIPAAVLLGQDGGVNFPPRTVLDWSRFPIQEMIKRGWLVFRSSRRSAVLDHAEELMRKFIEPFDEEIALPMCARQHGRDGKQMDVYALCAWKIRIMHLTAGQNVATYVPGSVTLDFIREVVRLSYFNDGPRLAREYLCKKGIHLVTERHLSKTYLDGAALMMPTGHPLVALTLRYDRLDNFWFTLAHELAHVALHLGAENQMFFDDLEAVGTSQQEIEADQMASEALMPGVAWKSASLSCRSSAAQITAFAEEARISPSIPAGRIRHEAKDHRIFWHLLGNHKVRTLFEEAIGRSTHAPS